jgi:hypothetical protein
MLVGFGPELADHCRASKLVPGLSLGWVDPIWSRELSLCGSFQLASAPETQRLVDDSAAVQVRVIRHIGIDTSQQIRVRRGRDLKSAPVAGCRRRHY